MGEVGAWSRILAKKFGAFATYVALSPRDATAPGQPLLSEMTADYRWASMNASTRVFGVIGDPVAPLYEPIAVQPVVLRTGRKPPSTCRFRSRIDQARSTSSLRTAESAHG